MVSIVADALAILTLVVATHPAHPEAGDLRARFWIISHLHQRRDAAPDHPRHSSGRRRHSRRTTARASSSRAYDRFERFLVWLSTGSRRGWMAAVARADAGLRPVLRAPAQDRRHDAGQGAALPGSPVQRRAPQGRTTTSSARARWSSSPRARSPRPSRTPTRSTSSTCSSATWSRARGAIGGSVTATTMLKTHLPRLPRGRSQVGDAADAQRSRRPAVLPAHRRHRARRDGSLLRPSYTNATITIFYKDYNHEMIKNSIARRRSTSPQNSARTTTCATGWQAGCSACSRRPDRGSGVVLPGERAADLRRRVHPELLDLRAR